MIKDREGYESNMMKVEAGIRNTGQEDYWHGYRKGLQRKYHGESVISTEEHIQWISYFDSPFTRDKGKGYIDGFFAEPTSCLTNCSLKKRHLKYL